MTKSQTTKTKSQTNSKFQIKKISAPISDEIVRKLKVGNKILISGKIYTARDAAHKKMKGTPPFDIKGQILYYASPTPTPPGKIIGSIGPTTSSRMDNYTEDLLKKGLKVMIGKGQRGNPVKEAIKKYKAVYLAVAGGTAALLSTHVKRSKVIAFPELGPEAILELEVANFPAIVAIDSSGGDIFDK